MVEELYIAHLGKLIKEFYPKVTLSKFLTCDPIHTSDSPAIMGHPLIHSLPIASSLSLKQMVDTYGSLPYIIHKDPEVIQSVIDILKRQSEEQDPTILWIDPLSLDNPSGDFRIIFNNGKSILWYLTAFVSDHLDKPYNIPLMERVNISVYNELQPINIVRDSKATSLISVMKLSIQSLYEGEQDNE